MFSPILQLRKDEIASRICNLKKILKKEGVDAILLEDTKDLFYFTGLDLSYGRLWVTKNKAVLFVDSRYIDVAVANSMVQPVELLKKENEIKFLSSANIHKVAFDGANLSYSRFFEIQNFLHSFLTSFELVSKEKISQQLRIIKGMCEIHDLKQSVVILKKAFNHLKSKIKVGISELEIAKEFELFIRMTGAEGSSFDPIVAFGKNASMPHYRPSNTKLKNNQLILLDLGCVYKKYRSDMTRILFHGTPDPLLFRAALLVRKAHKTALNLCKPGARVGDLDEAARKVFREEGVEQFFTHSLGHGIGLETHERPIIRLDSKDKDLILEPGMVITIEPGLYFKDKGGIRWEDMILITEKGHENLTKGI